MTLQAETITDRDSRVGDVFPFRHSYREPAQKFVIQRGRSKITNGMRFDPKKVKPGSSAARRYRDIQAELLEAAGPDISPQLKMMVPHIAALRMAIEQQENLLAAREPGFCPDTYGVMVDRLSRMIRTFFKPPRQSKVRGQRLSPEDHAALLRGQAQ